MATGGDVAKAGWLHRESSVLRRWKRNWFVLDKLGDLRYFESPNHHSAEERLVVRAVVGGIQTGIDSGVSNLPSNLSKSCVFTLKMMNGDRINLCAETPDDMKAWQIALEEARTAYGPPLSATQTIIQGQTVINPPNVVYANSPYQTTTVIGGGGYYPGRVITPGVVTAPGVVTSPGMTVVQGGQVYPTVGGTTTVIAAPPQQVVYMDNRYRSVYSTPFLW